MRDARRLTAVLLGCAGVLAGALAACATEDPRLAADAAAAPQQQEPCPGPPPAPADSLNGVPWSTLQPYVASLDFEMGISQTKPVRLCDSCNVMVIRIQSERRTPCLAQDSLGGRPRIIGRLTKLDQDTYQPEIGFGRDNPYRTVYLVADSANTGYGLYRDATDTARVVPQSPATSTGLWFRFCADGHAHEEPEARYRNRPSPPDTLAKDDDEETALQYGWMACANGCCRFYGSPPPPPPPPDPGPRPRPGQQGRTPASQVDSVCADTLS